MKKTSTLSPPPRALFQTIRNHNNKEVLTFINSNSALINASRQALPKKDCGQNGLQVALKAGDF